MPGIPAKLYTAEQVRRLDACAIGEHGIPGYELMNRAGKSVFAHAASRFGVERPWLVLCGAGNNAGDGYVIARLAAEAGIEVAVRYLKDPESLHGDAKNAAEDWFGSGGLAAPFEDRDLEAGLLIDAVLGTGLDRPLQGNFAGAVEWMNRHSAPVVAVDIPSGLNADTGCVMGVAVRADLTVSLIGLKRGLLTADGPDHAGELLFDDLGVPEPVYRSVPDHGRLIHEKYLAHVCGPRRRNSHKGSYGHVLLIGGAPGMGGAVRLAGEAALRSGAGLVSIATDPGHVNAVWQGRPELMVHACSAAGDIENLFDRATVIAAGPGLGQGAWSRELLVRCLDDARPLVVDADGLNLLAGMDTARSRWILTPHPAEAARLLECSTPQVQSDRVGAAQALAERYDAVVVLKGCGTVVAGPEGGYAICPLGNPGMATAGSGDVLTGLIAGLWAQGLATIDAARAGVVAHASAGDAAAAALGQRPMLAGDLNAFLAHVLS